MCAWRRRYIQDTVDAFFVRPDGYRCKLNLKPPCRTVSQGQNHALGQLAASCHSWPVHHGLVNTQRKPLEVWQLGRILNLRTTVECYFNSLSIGGPPTSVHILEPMRSLSGGSRPYSLGITTSASVLAVLNSACAGGWQQDTPVPCYACAVHMCAPDRNSM